MMMNEEKNDGPAFPVQYETGGADNSQITYFGISVRDYFAAKAMAAGISRWGGSGGMFDEGGCTHSLLASEAYQIADAMIAERNKP